MPWQPGGGGQSCPTGVMSFEGHVGIREAGSEWAVQERMALTVINVTKKRTGVFPAVSDSGYLTPGRCVQFQTLSSFVSPNCSHFEDHRSYFRTWDNEANI